MIVTAVDYRWLTGSALLCVVLAYVYPLSLSTPLFDPDEGLHAVIAQGMVESGDYLTPRFEGKFFRDKPILYFAAQALSLRALGMTEAAVRLPGFLFALLGAGTTWLLARRWFGRLAGMMSLLAALTMVIPMSIAQAGIHDVALVPWTNLLLLFLWELNHAALPFRRMGPWCGAAAVAALAILTKGLIGIAVVGSGYAVFLILSRKSIIRRGLRFTAVFMLGLLLASPWYFAMETRDPGYLKYYFFDRHLLGYLTTTQNHGHEPFYYYIPVVIGGAMPWILYALVGHARRDAGQPPSNNSDNPTTFVVCWLVGGALFLSLAGSKLVTYALPLFPAVAILAGSAWQRFLTSRLGPSAQRRFVLIATATAVAGTVAPLLLLSVVAITGIVAVPPGAWFAGFALSGVSAVILPLTRHGRFVPAVGVGAIWMALLLAFLMSWPVQIVAQHRSAKSLGLWLRNRNELPDRVFVVGERAYSAVFYLTCDQRRHLRNPVTRLRSTDEIEWRGMPSNVVIAVPIDEREQALHAPANLQFGSEIVGRFRVFFSNDCRPLSHLNSTTCKRRQK